MYLDKWWEYSNANCHSIQQSSQMIQISNTSQLCSYHRLAVSESFHFSSIAWVFKSLVCLNSLLWNHNCKFNAWSIMKTKELFIKKNISWIKVEETSSCLVWSFHCLSHLSPKHSNEYHSIQKNIWELKFHFLKDLELTYS